MDPLDAIQQAFVALNGLNREEARRVLLEALIEHRPEVVDELTVGELPAPEPTPAPTPAPTPVPTPEPTPSP